MALATTQDVEDYLGRDLTASESARVPFLLDRASDLVTSYVTAKRLADYYTSHSSTYPGAVVRTVAEMVGRLFEGKNYDPALAQMHQAAGSVSMPVSSGSVWLSDKDKQALAGAFSDTAGGTASTVWLA